MDSNVATDSKPSTRDGFSFLSTLQRALGYSTRRLTSVDDIERFARGYEMAFLHRGYRTVRTISDIRPDTQVWGVYRGDELVAGFMLAEYPARCLEAVDPDTLARVLRELGEANVCEITSLWKAPNKGGKALTLVLRATIGWRTLKMRRRYIFICNQSPALGRKWYHLVTPTFVSRARPGELEVFYHTRRRLVAIFAIDIARSVGRFVSSPLHVF